MGTIVKLGTLLTNSLGTQGWVPSFLGIGWIWPTLLSATMTGRHRERNMGASCVDRASSSIIVSVFPEHRKLPSYLYGLEISETSIGALDALVKSILQGMREPLTPRSTRGPQAGPSGSLLRVAASMKDVYEQRLEDCGSEIGTKRGKRNVNGHPMDKVG